MIKLNSGIPTIIEYKKLLESEEFMEMENFSDNFLIRNKIIFKNYSWVVDSLHQWSRQWEYPFVFEQVSKYMESAVSNKAKILDLGSGATFLPYYLKKNFPLTEVVCVDSDTALVSIYEGFNRNEKASVRFELSDIQKIPLPPESFEIIYCISVLEHTREYRKILEEVRRLLKPNGIFILTFDIAINGDTDISVSEAESLIREAGDIFPGNSVEDVNLEKHGQQLLTTSFFKGELKKLLPWKMSVRYMLYLLKEILKIKKPKTSFRKLTIWTGTYKKNENLHN